MLNLHEMFIAAIKLAFKNMQNYTLQIYHILTTIQTSHKRYKSRYADDRQSELYKKFPATSFFGTPQNVDHMLKLFKTNENS